VSLSVTITSSKVRMSYCTVFSRLAASMRSFTMTSCSISIVVVRRGEDSSSERVGVLEAVAGGVGMARTAVSSEPQTDD
jgi:hypothetical protein